MEANVSGVYESLGYANRITDSGVESPHRLPWKLLDEERYEADRGFTSPVLPRLWWQAPYGISHVLIPSHVPVPTSAKESSGIVGELLLVVTIPFISRTNFELAVELSSPRKGSIFNPLFTLSSDAIVVMSTIAVVSGENASAQNPEQQKSTTFNVGTRKSKLALVQTDLVVKALTSAWPDHVYAIKARDTAAGDIDKVTPFKDMPVKNIWTHELETLMIEGQLDILVHSLKGSSLIWLYLLSLTRSRCANTTTAGL
jgi:hypothetical protein